MRRKLYVGEYIMQNIASKFEKNQTYHSRNIVTTVLKSKVLRKT